MYTTDFLCEKCNHLEECVRFKSYAHFKEEENNQVCPKCQNKMIMVFTAAPSFFTKEGFGPDSSKSSSYWRNAERNRINRQNKKDEVEKEKKYYGKRQDT